MTEKNDTLQLKYKIVYIVIFAIIAFSIIWAVLHLFGGGPLQRALDKTVGTIALTAEGLVSGCTPQSDCKKLKSKDSCVAGNGCFWSDEKDKSGGTCINPSGRKPNPNGGFFSPTCSLGMFFIVALLGTFLLKAVGIFMQPKSESIKAIIETSGKPKNEVVKKIVDTARKRYESMDIKPTSDEQAELIGKATIHDVISDVAKNVDTSGDIQAEQEMDKVQSDAAKEVEKTVSEAADKTTTEKEIKDELERVAKEHPVE